MTHPSILSMMPVRWALLTCYRVGLLFRLGISVSLFVVGAYGLLDCGCLANWLLPLVLVGGGWRVFLLCTDLIRL